MLYGSSPLLSWVLTFALCCLIAFFFVAVNSWLAKRSKKAESNVREQLDRIMAASEPRPWSAPAAKGWENRKRAS